LGFDVLYASGRDYDLSAGCLDSKRLDCARCLIARAMHGASGAARVSGGKFALPWPAWLARIVPHCWVTSIPCEAYLAGLDAAFFASDGYISLLFLLFLGRGYGGLAHLKI